MLPRTIFLLCLIPAAACSRLDHVGKAPSFTPQAESAERVAMAYTGVPTINPPERASDNASLWSREKSSLLGDRRALKAGDILTVVIDFDESAEISNSTSRARSSSESMGIPQLFGIPQEQDLNLPAGASLANAVDLSGSGTSNGNGAVNRSEQLTLRVAATITDVMPNGVLAIQGAQEIRVNFEMRELLVSGFVRPEDITRKNEITYDKIASAKISYGGRGQITDVQQPRYGQQVLDMILPF
ncbi:flagellar biosynthesis protein FlgH [Salipiger aestuarii]|uniref:Flagellar L-ring protein n=1 Tax=Salipiger aestuarii TaxID=568098 RepID=A0A327XLA2_9RHOB|nr:flagellar basal body L-ring protein FlgH [Salipiger aestuarii]EIE52420.1 flagellar basal body L-ring protein [Citreicella sp. 357]KAA8604339.1 flagellar biosynthesis protein FlgH [Salipiger aestuarii]KAA8606288.1 flagellar biosynthesis protein FlgH [Salipiger aestuarii]KAB2532273.1 flagellar biosynthesis protein FlgH [Salipiger aestuarii]RAK09888.1 flagellar L-ring protein precursor FlgH [Salipiger aestuarii]